jgi:hypothetical protein
VGFEPANSKKPAAADTRLKQRGHRDRQLPLLVHVFKPIIFLAMIEANDEPHETYTNKGKYSKDGHLLVRSVVSAVSVLTKYYRQYGKPHEP